MATGTKRLNLASNRSNPQHFAPSPNAPPQARRIRAVRKLPATCHVPCPLTSLARPTAVLATHILDFSIRCKSGKFSRDSLRKCIYRECALAMPATTTCQPIRLNYFLRIPNVGDRINPDIVTAISRCHTFHVAGIRVSHLVAAGSMMAVTTPESQVWGTGVMHPDFGVGGVVAANIHAVRGKLSHS